MHPIHTAIASSPSPPPNSENRVCLLSPDESAAFLPAVCSCMHGSPALWPARYHSPHGCRVSIAVATRSLRNLTDLVKTSVEPAVIGRPRALGGRIQQRFISSSNYSMMYITGTQGSRLLHLAMLPFLIPSF